MSRRVAACVLVAAALGCRTLPYPEPELPGSYGALLGKWMRKATLYSRLETHAFARAVYLSPELVDAQAREVSRMRSELPAEAAQTHKRMRESAATPTVFAIFYTPDRTANDWNEKKSIWRIALNLGLGEVEPEKIERIDRPFNAELRALYPYLDEYSTAYVIHFPAQAAPPQRPLPTSPQAAPPAPAPSFTPTAAQLLISSALGTMRFEWDLQRLAQAR